MSIKVMSWAWQQEVSPSAKIILLALADHSDDDGTCWPGQKGIAQKCGLSRKTVNEQIGKMVDAGLISKTNRHRDDGSLSSNIYQLNVSQSLLGSNVALLGSHPELQGVVTQRYKGSNVALQHETSIETSIRNINEEDAIKFEPLQSTLGHYKGFKATPQLVSKVASKYSHVDLEEEAIKMLSWLEENPKRLCSPAFILNWLSKQYNGSNNYPPATDQTEATYSPGGGHLERTTTKRY